MTIDERKPEGAQDLLNPSAAEEISPSKCAAESILDLATLLSKQDDLQEMLRIIASNGVALFHADVFTIMMVNPVTQHTIKTVMKVGMTHDERTLHLLCTNITGWVMKHVEPFLSNDIPNDPRFTAGLLAGCGIVSAMCVPMWNEKQVCGHILVASRDERRRFADVALGFLEKCASVWGAFLNGSQKVQEYFRSPIPDDVLLSKYAALGLLGKSRRFRELLRSVDAASKCDVRVFLEGESGSGKDVIAMAIHKLGSRRQHPYIALDCGAIPAGLIESELFGHAKGAFTGANHARHGLLEEADHGTLFMDEIENLPYDMQAKLLRVLQDGEVRAVGSNQTRKVDVRIIAASRTAAARLVKEKILREDLFYRLHVYPISIPTLNERKEDIPLLAEHFVKEYAGRQQKVAGLFRPSLIHFMREKLWDGNIRELENFVERMVTVAAPDQKMLDETLLPPEYLREFHELTRLRSGQSPRKPLRECLREYEYRILREALIAHGWNQSEAARDLRISERAMRYKMGRLRLGNSGPQPEIDD